VGKVFCLVVVEAEMDVRGLTVRSGERGRNVGKSGGFKYGECGCGCKAAGKSDQISDSQISGQPDLADFTRA
jgi:hypothetical protein